MSFTGTKNALELTWRQVADLPRETTAVFVVLAPVEEHSHHLPLGTDLYEGEHWLEAALALLESQFPAWTFLRLPSFPIAAGSGYGFPGNIHFSARTLQRTARQLLEQVAAWGVRNIVVVASHGDPHHQIAIEEACAQVNRRHGVRAFSPMGAFFSASELGIDLNLPPQVAQQMQASPNDFHAGWIETSAMMAIAPRLVREGWQLLPDRMVRDREMIFPGKVARGIAGYGHIGSPRHASAELGLLLNRNVAEFLAAATASFLTRGDYTRYQHHFLYRMPFLRTGFLRAVLWVVALVCAAAAVAWRLLH